MKYTFTIDDEIILEAHNVKEFKVAKEELTKAKLNYKVFLEKEYNEKPKTYEKSEALKKFFKMFTNKVFDKQLHDKLTEAMGIDSLVNAVVEVTRKFDETLAESIFKYKSDDEFIDSLLKKYPDRIPDYVKVALGAYKEQKEAITESNVDDLKTDISGISKLISEFTDVYGYKQDGDDLVFSIGKFEAQELKELLEELGYDANITVNENSTITFHGYF